MPSYMTDAPSHLLPAYVTHYPLLLSLNHAIHSWASILHILTMRLRMTNVLYLEIFQGWRDKYSFGTSTKAWIALNWPKYCWWTDRQHPIVYSYHCPAHTHTLLNIHHLSTVTGGSNLQAIHKNTVERKHIVWYNPYLVGSRTNSTNVLTDILCLCLTLAVMCSVVSALF